MIEICRFCFLFFLNLPSYYIFSAFVKNSIGAVPVSAILPSGLDQYPQIARMVDLAITAFDFTWYQIGRIIMICHQSLFSNVEGRLYRSISVSLNDPRHVFSANYRP